MMVNERNRTIFAAAVAVTAALAACAVVAFTNANAPALPAGAASTSLKLLPPLPLVDVAVLVLVQFVFARKHFGDYVGALAALLTACSPLALGLARTESPDVLCAAAQVATLWLFLDVVRERENRSALVLCPIAFAAALVLKERSLVLAAPMLAFALYERFVNRREVRFGWVAFTLVVPMFVAFVLWSIGDGSFAAAFVGPRNDYTQLLGRGAWHRHVVDLLLLSPWTMVAAIGAVALVACRRRQGEDESVVVYLALAAVLAIIGCSFGSMSVRDVLAVDVLLRVLVVGHGWNALRLGESRRVRLIAVAAVLLLCTAEIASFRTLFLEERIADPTSAALLEARKFVPSTKGG